MPHFNPVTFSQLKFGITMNSEDVLQKLTIMLNIVTPEVSRIIQEFGQVEAVGLEQFKVPPSTSTKLNEPEWTKEKMINAIASGDFDFMQVTDHHLKVSDVVSAHLTAFNGEKEIDVILHIPTSVIENFELELV